MSKLMQLRVMLKPGADGQLTPVLCDASGEPLPGQLAIKIATAVDEVATVTVTFGMIEFAVE